MRYPAISPDGKTIVFSYKGDLYKVSSGGGDATPLTFTKHTIICLYGAVMANGLPLPATAMETLMYM